MTPALWAVVDAVVLGGLCAAAIVGTAWNWAQESIEDVLRRRNARKAWPKTFRAP